VGHLAVKESRVPLNQSQAQRLLNKR